MVKFSEKVMQYVGRSIYYHSKKKFSNPTRIILYIR